MYRKRGDHVARGRLDEVGDRRTKGELSREDMHDILQGMQDLRGWPAVVDSQRARGATHTRAAPAEQYASGGLASVGDLAKSRRRKRQGRAPRVHLALL